MNDHISFSSILTLTLKQVHRNQPELLEEVIKKVLHDYPALTGHHVESFPNHTAVVFHMTGDEVTEDDALAACQSYGKLIYDKFDWFFSTRAIKMVWEPIESPLTVINH